MRTDNYLDVRVQGDDLATDTAVEAPGGWPLMATADSSRQAAIRQL
jgi:hypothetical protein